MCTISDDSVFKNFMLADEPFANILRIFETFVLVNNNLCGKLVLLLELPIKFYEIFKFTSVPFLLAILTD